MWSGSEYSFQFLMGLGIFPPLVIRFKNLKMLLKTSRSLVKNNQTELIVSVRTSVLHHVTVELGLVSFLLLQIDASDKAAPVQLHVMAALFSKSSSLGSLILILWLESHRLGCRHLDVKRRKGQIWHAAPNHPLAAAAGVGSLEPRGAHEQPLNRSSRHLPVASV
ncbi:hypothetical protein EYF80_016592 [Liparis tanakae]|uniref:Uncharacterized protein n=1 Tax=Liparis tanakae TaxID=230148 RepID=A0A4Z2I4W0_9TELE|nr:hypothetical protein EYF80_016592 [Liparis tanakae]